MNVSSRIRSDGDPSLTSHATRAHSVVVFPVPAPARIKQRPAGVGRGRSLLVVELVEPGAFPGIRHHRHGPRTLRAPSDDSLHPHTACLTGYRIDTDGG